MIVGLAGNIGSGKSTVSKRLAQVGAEVTDTDQVARDVVAGRIAEYRAGRGSAPVLVVEVPLLIESGMHRMTDEIWVVTVHRDAR